MAAYKYRPDYESLYSKEKLAGECLTKEVLTALRKSDRKMEYQEYDLKTERIRISQGKRTVKLISCRENSLDRMLELGDEFAADEKSVADEAVEKVLIEQMMDCVRRLPKQNQELIYALFFDGQTERDIAQEQGVSQVGIHKRKRRILRRIKKMMEK